MKAEPHVFHVLAGLFDAIYTRDSWSFVNGATFQLYSTFHIIMQIIFFYDFSKN